MAAADGAALNTMIDAFTLAAAPRAAEVRVLARSVGVALPRARFLWAVCGLLDEAKAARLDSGEVAPLEVACPSRRGGPSPGGVAAAQADAAGAMPEVALSLLRRPDCDGVLFLAPQVVLFSSLPELFAGQPKADVVLVPSLLHPEAASTNDLPTGELRALRHGVFSTSLVAVAPTPTGERFLRWWSDRTREFVPPPDAHHGLRPWLNLAPALFEGIRVLRFPGCAVGRENLHERRLDGGPEEGFTVEGEPLTFFDFTGLDDGSLEAAISRSRGDRRALAALVEWYRDCRRDAAELDPAATRASSGGGS